MSGSSIYLALLNSTTIENLSRKTKVWQLAILVPNSSSSVRGQDPEQPSLPYTTVTYPLPSTDGAKLESQNPPLRTFAILRSRPGENPYDLGYYRNWCSVMGDRPMDWFSIKRSPCCDHERWESEFELGPVVDRMRREAGLLPINGPDSSRRKRRRRKSSTVRETDRKAESRT